MHAVNQLPRFGPNPALLWSARTKRLWGCKIRIDIFIANRLGIDFWKKDARAKTTTLHLQRLTSEEAPP